MPHDPRSARRLGGRPIPQTAKIIRCRCAKPSGVARWRVAPEEGPTAAALAIPPQEALLRLPVRQRLDPTHIKTVPLGLRLRRARRRYFPSAAENGLRERRFQRWPDDADAHSRNSRLNRVKKNDWMFADLGAASIWSASRMPSASTA